ncbi:MAG: hypothetical protein Fur005_33450 [Roseiflexaceae bacterium]
MRPFTLISPTCSCCPAPTELIPRDDLPGRLAACPNTGQLYRPEGKRFVPASLPPIAPERPAPSITIDLSREGYA